MTFKDQATDLDRTIYLAYGCVMALIVSGGILGNFTFLLVLFQPEHRKRPMSILIMNMCVADSMVCLFGYSIALSNSLSSTASSLGRDLWGCKWIAFINCITGIDVIATLTAMSYMSYKGVTSLEVSNATDQRKNVAPIVGGTWVYAILCAIPPVFGWNEFIPVAGYFSCQPNWLSQEIDDVAYIVLLTLGGFLVPIVSITFFYLKMFTFMKQNSFKSAVSNDPQRQRQLAMEKKTIRAIFIAILTFLVSWSPYCLVSLSSTVKGYDILTPTASLVPQIMAKASVIYNPIVYLSLNSRFRGTLKRFFTKVRVKPRINLSRRQNSKSIKDENNVLASERRVKKNECLAVFRTL